MTEAQEIERLLLKINDNIIVLRKVENMLVGAVVELNNHNKDVDAHKGAIKNLQLGVDITNVERLTKVVGRLLLKNAELELKCQQLTERVNTLEKSIVTT